MSTHEAKSPTQAVCLRIVCANMKKILAKNFQVFDIQYILAVLKPMAFRL